MGVHDQKILQVAGINVSEAAKMLGRSRQTVNRGVKKPTSEYFRINDMLSIHKALLRRDSFIAKKFLQYLQENDPEFRTIELRGDQEADEEFSAAEEVWILCNSFDELDSIDNSLAEKIFKFLRNRNGMCNFIFSDSSYEELCVKRLEAEEIAHGRFSGRYGTNAEPAGRFITPVFVFIRETQSSVFIVTCKGLERIPGVCANRILKELRGRSELPLLNSQSVPSFHI